MTETLDQPDDSQLLRVRRDGQGEVVIVHVGGEVDLATAPRLADELTRIEEQDTLPKRVVVDLTDVTFLASAGLQTLLEHEQRCRDTNIDLRVVASNRTVVRTIVLTGLTEVLGVRPSLAEALETT